MYAAPVLPPIVVHSHDYNQLVLAGTLAHVQGRPFARFLLAELRRATLCRFEELPGGVVTIGSRVTYRLKGSDVAALTGTLVFDEVDRCPGSVSVASPIGTALLGLRAGDRMPFQLGGQECEVLVERVEHPAEEGRESVPRRQEISTTNSKESLDRRLDHALEETFPASDPVSVGVPDGTEGRLQRFTDNNRPQHARRDRPRETDDQQPPATRKAADHHQRRRSTAPYRPGVWGSAMTRRRDAKAAAGKASPAAKTFKIGDHVSWNSEAGRVSGRIVKVHTRDVNWKGYVHHASARDPQYEIKSDRTDHVALHKGGALKLIGSRK